MANWPSKMEGEICLVQTCTAPHVPTKLTKPVKIICYLEDMFMCTYPEQQLIEHLSTVLAAWQPWDLF